MDEDGYFAGIVFMSENKNLDYQQVEALEYFKHFVVRSTQTSNTENISVMGVGHIFGLALRLRTWSRCARNTPWKTFPTIDLNQTKRKVSVTLLVPLLSVLSIEYSKRRWRCNIISRLCKFNSIRVEQSTKKFKFLIVEEFVDLQQETDQEAMPVPNIFKLYSFRIFKHDLIGKVWTCSEHTAENGIRCWLYWVIRVNWKFGWTIQLCQ